MTSVSAVLYAAKSTEDRHGSIPTQLNDAHQLVAARRGEVIAEFTDEGFSAYHGNRGPGLEQAKRRAAETASAKGSCLLVVQHSDRLARGAGDGAGSADHLGEVIFWARRSGVTLCSVQDPQTFENLLLGVMMGERNHEDSKRKSAATRAGKQRRFEAGKRLGGPVPDGYKLVPTIDADQVVRRYVIDEERAATIRRIYELSLSGLSAASVARKLNDAGLRSARGKPWSGRRAPDADQSVLHRSASAARADT